ncbi:MAG: Holliday junction branch migration protein RuvA, partial [Calditrichaeota bacterium]
MIGFLRGTIIERQPTRLLIDVHGVGYDVHIPLSTYEQIKAGDTQVSLQTYLHVREDVLQLYGFATLAEKKLFLQLIAVSGIGPKVALGILSGCTVDEFYQAVHRGEIARLKALPGIGRKTAERLI